MLTTPVKIKRSARFGPVSGFAVFNLVRMITAHVVQRLIEGRLDKLDVVIRQITATDDNVYIVKFLLAAGTIDKVNDFIADREDLHSRIRFPCPYEHEN